MLRQAQHKGGLRTAQANGGASVWHHQIGVGFRQFMLRVLEKVGHEWTLVCLAWNLKRMAVSRQNSVQSW